MRKKTENMDIIVDKKTVRITTAVFVTVMTMLATIASMFFTTMSVLAADAGSSSNSQSTIRTTVPDSHNIRVEKSHADVVIEGEEDQTLEEVCEDTTLVIETAEDTSGGESKDPDKDKDPGKNPDKDKDPNKGTPGTGKGHESEKKTPLNKLKNQMAAVTGDEARPMLYVLAAIAAVVVISVTVIRRKNK